MTTKKEARIIFVDEILAEVKSLIVDYYKNTEDDDLPPAIDMVELALDQFKHMKENIP